MSKNILTYRVIHNSATRSNRIVRAQDIIDWHTAPPPRGNGWSVPGYSDVILRSGELVNIVPYNRDMIVDPWEITNGVLGINYKSRHVCMIGGLDARGNYAAEYTPEQWMTLRNLLIMDVAIWPHIKIGGHYQWDSGKPNCPGFDVIKKLREWGFNEQNIK